MRMRPLSYDYIILTGHLNSFSDNFLTPARSNCQFLCSDDIPKRSPKQTKKIHQNDVKNAPVPFPYWLSLYG
jgi:hypothetical protein